MFWSHYPKTYPLIVLIIGLYILKVSTLLVYRRRNKVKTHDNFIIGINSIYYIFLSILLILLVMVSMKVNIREFFTSISIIAAAIAILSKDYISNAINGMILMFNNQISIGDHIKIGQHKGKIIHISLLNLQLLNEEEDLIYIPNTLVLSLDVINYTKGHGQLSSFTFSIRMENWKSFDVLNQQLEKALNDSGVILKDTFNLKVLHLNSKRIEMRAHAKLSDKEYQAEYAFKEIVLKAVLGE